MLEKNEKFYCDSHFHFADCDNCFLEKIDFPYKAASCALNCNQWKIQQKAPSFIKKGFGLHPQNADDNDAEKELAFLEELLQTKKADFIGEIGFDFFSERNEKLEKVQNEVFVHQTELAVQYSKNVVIHSRKAMDFIYKNADLLKKVPAVLFHSFMGNSVEALSLEKKGINCFFSFGKQIFNNNKKVFDCLSNLPLDVILLETDAPFQFLKGETKTEAFEIKKVYEGAYDFYKKDYEYFQFLEKIHSNFKIFFE